MEHGVILSGMKKQGSEGDRVEKPRRGTTWDEYYDANVINASLGECRP
jgi:hypothetical protein